MFCSPLFIFGQSEILAYNYIDRGEYEKAISILEEINSKQPFNINASQKLISCYQQLKQFDKSEKIILDKIKLNQNYFIVELGYNFQLQKKQNEAEKNYKLALAKVNENPNLSYNYAAAFEQKGLLSYAYQTYEVALKENPNMPQLNYQMALIQGQMGNLEIMISKLLDYAQSNSNQSTLMVQNQLSMSLNEDLDGSFSSYLKKDLLLRTQKFQDIYWNQFLSWMYMQQKEYNKAFIQEKAIYKRNPESFEDILQLARLCVQDKDSDTAKEIYQFVIENTTDEETIINAHYFLLKNEIDNSKPEQYPLIQQKIDGLLAQYQSSPFSIDLVLLCSNFNCFNLNNFIKSKELLDAKMNLPGNTRQKAKIKMELANQLVFNEKFNQAILNYGQVFNDLPNDEMAHEASLKMAKTSFYKKDFEWAQKQAEELKKANSQLIANDAVELFLLISDHIAEDSLKVSLHDFAKADLLEYQNKNKESLTSFLDILKKHKGKSIEPNAIYKVAKNYEKLGEYTKALDYYNELLTQHKDCIFIDEALFFIAEIYRNKLNNNNKSKEYYEKVILEHPDSIFFTESRKQYRILRGDKQEKI